MGPLAEWDLSPQAATDTFLREYTLASALGEVVAALGRVRPTVWILRSLASDTQDETSTVSLLASFEAASSDEGLLPFPLSNLLYMENPYSYKKCQ